MGTRGKSGKAEYRDHTISDWNSNHESDVFILLIGATGIIFLEHGASAGFKVVPWHSIYPRLLLPRRRPGLKPANVKHPVVGLTKATPENRFFPWMYALI